MTTKELQDALDEITGKENNIWTVLRRAYDKGSKDTLDALGKSGTLTWGQVADFQLKK